MLWVRVTNPTIDHRSLSLTARVKRPPAPATLVPLQRMPGGLWKLPQEPRGFLQIALDVLGNYLNKNRFSLKSNPIQLTLPVTEKQSVNFDAQGRPVLSSRPAAGKDRALATTVREPSRESLLPPSAPGAAGAGIQPPDAGAADSPGLSPAAG